MKVCALAGFAVRDDIPPALFDGPVRCRKAETRTLAPFLGGEKRLENVGLDLLGHADPGVAERQQSVPSGGLGAGFALLLAHKQIRRLDHQLAAVRHGIPGIARQIHDHLLKLHGIGFYFAEGRFELRAQFDLFPDESAQHGLNTFYDFVQVNYPGLQDLTPAESQKLARQVGGVLSCVVKRPPGSPASGAPASGPSA